jgi:TolA-binding protein
VWAIDAVAEDAPADPAAESRDAPREAPAPDDAAAAPAAPDAAAAPAPDDAVAAPAAAAEPAPIGRVLPDGRQLHDPTPQDLEGLRILEEEFERYSERAGGFHTTINTVVRREHHRRRGRLLEEFERQIGAEEALLTEARRRAIEEFEAFLRRYPNDATYTPDAMFRLAELYYEDSYETFLDEADQYAELQERREGGEELELPPEPVKDFSRTVGLFRRLIAEYPRYRHIDGALYLLGFCLNETGLFEEARMAWLNLVCQNEFQYEGPVAVDDDGAEHPAANVPLRESAPEGEVFTNPYAQCTPIDPESRFLDETWLRIGEYHFDYDYSRFGLEHAIAAYQNAMSDPESPFYDKALYKLAWSYYRANRYVEAIRHFAMLVEFSDEHRDRFGRSGSEMRPEAIQYLGISFAEDDWNDDQQPDAERGIDRLQNPEMLPQDRPYTSEVYFQTGDTYFDLARYADAIAVYELALRRWPIALEAPRVVERIAQAHERNREFEDAIIARARLRDYGPESQWAQENEEEHPEAVREAGQLARNALYDDAVRHHQLAQTLRQRAVDEQNPSLLERARDEYNLAAQGYRAYIDQYPNDPDAYEISFNLAEAMYFSGQFEDAARAYVLVRDSNLDDRFRAQAAFRTIKSLESIRDAEVEAGRLTLREEPPDPSGDPAQVTPIPIPEILQRLNEARDEHQRLLPESARNPVFRYQTAQVFYRYGHWEEARRRFRQIYDDYCTSNGVGYYSWQNMVNMAGALNNLDAAEQLARLQTERRCAPPADEVADGSEGPAGPSGPSGPVDPMGEAQQILTGARFRHAQDRFNQARAAEAAGRSEAASLYEQSAGMFMEAIEGAPDHPEAASAMNNAALAYEEVDRYESAMAVWRRIVEDYPESEFVDVARFRLAYNAYRFFEYDEAVSHFQLLARSSKSADIRRDSILNTATILTNLEQYSKAAPYWRQYAEPGIAPSDAARAEAGFRAVEMTYKQQDWRGTVRDMKAYIAEYRTLGAAGQYRVRAAYLIADSHQKLRSTTEYYRALEGVTSEFQTSGEKAGSLSAEYAAEARFRLVDREIDSLEGYKVGGTSKQITQQIEDGARRVAELEKSYKAVTAYRRPAWTVASHYRIGYAYELLAKALLESEPPTDSEQILVNSLPADVRRDLARIPAAQRRELLREQIDGLEQQWREDMVKRVGGMEDRAVSEYELCVRAAREGNIVSDYTRQAYERLFAYRPEQYPLQREGRFEMQLDSVAPPSPASGAEPSPYGSGREPASVPREGSR